MTITERVVALESRNIGFELVMKALEAKDTETGHAVQLLTESIRDPETGLIVQVRELRTEMKNDRRRLVLGIGVLIGLAQLTAPYLPAIGRIVLGLPTP